eukprot:PhM_4_TR477/c1_g1_i1/m.27535/K10357/MYO5; myosin V
MPFAPKTIVAWNSPDHSWVIGEVVAYDPKGKHYTCTATDPDPQTAPKIYDNDEWIFASEPENFEEDVNDLLQLTELHESTLLFCLKRRYLRDVVYTNIGPIVVALNPFNFNIPWYMDKKMPDYLAEGVVIEQNLPHSWAVAHNTYWELRENGQNQTILISGESGAGKTEGAKIVVKYLGAISTIKGTTEQKSKCEEVNKRIIAASPILESFGNAKTVRNDNSSRFGKFSKLQFDRDGFLVGNFVIKYLLEKSRIVTASKDERVYHSFYQVVSGSDRLTYGLKEPHVYHSLTVGDCINIPGVDDSEDHAFCKAAMSDVGITDAEQDAIWRCVAGILNLQNVDVSEKEEKAMKMSYIDEQNVPKLEQACALFEIDAIEMQKEITTTTTVTRGEVVEKPLDRVKALDVRDSTSKTLYDCLFDWLVSKINQTTDASSRCTHWVGLLDIFGFEDFQFNSFEQLCINLANEALQSHYNNFIFTEDMKECREEGIDVSAVTFSDNKACLDLLMGKTNSVFSALDEECKVNGTERNFLDKLNTGFASSKEKVGNAFYLAIMGKRKDNHFGIRHYAGDVVYCVDNFLEKNKDNLKDAVRKLFGQSKDPLISQFMPPPQEGVKLTVGGFFKNQLRELMDVIHATNPHWIRCIKPHPAKQPKKFSHKSVINQLRSAGVLDTVKVRKAGFPIRFRHELFVKRFGLIIGVYPSPGENYKQTIDKLFSLCHIELNMGQVGKTKVFLRQAGFLALNREKEAVLSRVCLVIQNMGRSFLARGDLFKLYIERHRALIMEQRRQKEEAERRRQEEERLRLLKEEADRKAREEAERVRVHKSVVTCQRMIRGWLARLSFFRVALEGLRAKEELRIDVQCGRVRKALEEVDKRRKWLEEREFEKQSFCGDVLSFKARAALDRQHRQELAEQRRHQQDEKQQRDAELRERQIMTELENRRLRREREKKEKAEVHRSNAIKGQQIRQDHENAELRRMEAHRQSLDNLKRREEQLAALRLRNDAKFVERMADKAAAEHRRAVFDGVTSHRALDEEWELSPDELLLGDIRQQRDDMRQTQRRQQLTRSGNLMFAPAVLPTDRFNVPSLRNTTKLSGEQQRLERAYQRRVDARLAVDEENDDRFSFSTESV